MSSTINAPLESSSEVFQDIYQLLESAENMFSSYKSGQADVYYLLELADSSKIEPYCSKMSKQESWEISTSEDPHTYWFLLSLIDRINGNIEEIEPFQSTIQTLKRTQDSDGHIMGEGGTAGHARILQIAANADESLNKATNYVLDEVTLDTQTRFSDLPLALLLLAEVDYYDYEDEIEMLAERIQDNCEGYQSIIESLSNQRDEQVSYLSFQDSIVDLQRLRKTGLSVWALSRASTGHDFAEEFSNFIESSRIIEYFSYLNDEKEVKTALAKEELATGMDSELVEERVSDPDEADIVALRERASIDQFNNLNVHRVLLEPVKTLAGIGLGVAAAGKGPKVSRVQARWQQDVHQQQITQVTPEFVATIPATSLGKRETAIRERATKMVTDATETLYVSSLYIDMVYEQIIDACKQPDGPTVKILARKPSDVDSGSRQSIKKSVISELVKVTEGNVRSTPPLHSRMLIADDSQLLVTTADLTRDQLVDYFNSGLYTEADEPVANAVEFFDMVWERSERVEP